MDVDENKVRQMQSEKPDLEQDLEALMVKNYKAGRLDPPPTD